ncbi:hypothetical protein SH584_11310 [Sphingomonas sp. LY29]|uniref:DUF968 domain-containing protein n=1 Tax=Sphingomonas sp. LY29 TaxID=3095341 RepID=UPI002D7900DA|nr:hypothetical protein [Sphingomonas sp. LY29]WRP25619.1 hypothetical protein SH584_11310 [Sphingomonas sp. LY29]
MDLMLPRRIPKEPKRESRWRSPAHTTFVRGFACAMCGSTTNIEAAHVRMGSGAGMGQKPDDWRTVPLCGGGGCHSTQHTVGEPVFWKEYHKNHGQGVEQLIAELIKASPKRREIETIRSTRGPGLANNRPGQGS